MKRGANLTDQRQIILYEEQGATAKQISEALKIDVKVVQSFMKEKVTKAKKKVKERDDAAQKEHAEIMEKKKG